MENKEFVIKYAEAPQISKDELSEIFNGCEGAISIMERTFEEHKDVKTVIVNPNSWIGKELLIQTKRLIYLRKDVYALSSAINRVEKKLDLLLNAQK